MDLRVSVAFFYLKLSFSDEQPLTLGRQLSQYLLHLHSVFDVSMMSSSGVILTESIQNSASG